MNLSALLSQLIVDDWRAVPARVTEVLAKAASCWDEVSKCSLKQSELLLLQPDRLQLARFERDSALVDDAWFPVKSAAGLLEPVANTVTALQKPFGGPSPLTAAITSGLLLGGAGYGAGALLERFMPEKRFERGRLRKVLGLAGVGLGAAPFIGSGFYNPGGFLGKYPWHKESCAKQADFGGSTGMGGLYMETIPVDAFNAAVWNDVEQAPSRFGTKSPWHDNSQRLRTPPAAAAAVTGALAGAKLLTGSDRVSPFEVATAATTYGLGGLLGGMAAGKLLGALAGLKPESQQQQQLQQTGMWAGVIDQGHGAYRADCQFNVGPRLNGNHSEAKS